MSQVECHVGVPVKRVLEGVSPTGELRTLSDFLEANSDTFRSAPASFSGSLPLRLRDAVSSPESHKVFCVCRLRCLVLSYAGGTRCPVLTVSVPTPALVLTLRMGGPDCSATRRTSASRSDPRGRSRRRRSSPGWAGLWLRLLRAREF